MGCVSGKQKQKRASFQYGIYERAQPFVSKEEQRFDINKNPIVQRRVKSNSHTSDQNIRTKQYSDYLPSSKRQF